MLKGPTEALCPWVDHVLREQLKRGERKRVSRSAVAVQKTSLVPTSSIYWQQTFDERMRGHEQIRAAVNLGAIEVRWCDQGGEDRALEWLRVRDLDALAAFLGVATNASQLNAARDGLAPWLNAYPRLNELLDAWTELRLVRGTGPSSWHIWRDAVRVLEALAGTHGEDQVVRVLSGHLFSDTKRIEALLPQLDALSAEGLTNAPRGKWEVLRALGLVKQPQPLMVAGVGTILMRNGPDCVIARPYVGVALPNVRGLVAAPSWVLTIENLTTFHLAAEALQGCADGLVVFTGGMPSPAWVSGFRRLTGQLPLETTFYHWGDIDVGGFRIAARLQRSAMPDGVKLRPWLMDLVFRGCGEEVSDSIRDAMRSGALQAGWSEFAELPARTLEQERVDVVLPVRST